MEIEKNVITIERGSAPRILWSGEDFLLEPLPPGTRVIYARKPMEGLPDPKAAIRYAINHPEGCDPLFALPKPGMKVTIAIDDLSMPLPRMKRPDVREQVLDVVMPLLSDYGVDDIHLIVATSFHRRMTADEIEYMVGPKVFKEYWPDRLYNHDGEDKDNMVTVTTTEQGEVVRLNRRAAESDLIIYINQNLVPMNGGHKSVTVGLCGYDSLRAHHNPKTLAGCDSYMDPKRSALADTITRMGRAAQEHLNVFTIETVVNTRMFDRQTDFLGRNEDDFSSADWAKFRAMQWALKKMPRGAKRSLLHNIPAPYDLIGVFAGKTEPVHEKTVERNFQQLAVPVKGQADVMIVPIPFISPYNVNATLNPLLVQVMALGYLFSLYRGKPLIKKGGVMIVTHPCYDEWTSAHHPSYIEFFHRILAETRDSYEMHKKYEWEFATNPSYLSMYRTGNAFHGVHPFYMWYWGDPGRSHVGRVIVAGAESPYVTKLLGWEHAPNLREALDMARDTAGPNPEIVCLKSAPICLADVE